MHNYSKNLILRCSSGPVPGTLAKLTIGKLLFESSLLEPKKSRGGDQLAKDFSIKWYYQKPVYRGTYVTSLYTYSFTCHL